MRVAYRRKKACRLSYIILLLCYRNVNRKYPNPLVLIYEEGETVSCDGLQIRVAESSIKKEQTDQIRLSVVLELAATEEITFDYTRIAGADHIAI